MSWGRKAGRPQVPSPLKYTIATHVDARTKNVLVKLAEDEDRDLAYIVRAAIKFYLKAKRK
jgi:hypothetical protein